MKSSVSQRPYSPATKVVAPQGSPTKADFYTDGVADNVQIQAALDALFSGTFTFTGAPIATETLVIGADTYTFRATRTVAFEITIGANVTETAANMVTAFNLDNTNTGLIASSSAGVVIISGKQVNATESATNTTFTDTSAGSVYIAKGNYAIAATINIACDNIRIYGDGKGTVLKLDASVANYIFTFDPGDFRNHVIMEYMKLDGNQANNASGGCIKASATVSCTFRSLHITAGKDYGINFLGKTGGAFGHNNTINDCLIDGRCATCLHFSANDENEIYGNTINDFVNNGVYDQGGLLKVHDNTFTGISGTTGVGYRSLDISNSVILNNHFDGIFNQAIIVKGSSCIISGNRIYNPSAAGSGVSPAITNDYYSNNLYIGNYVSGSNHSYAYEELSISGNNVVVGNFFEMGTVALFNISGLGAQIQANNNLQTITNELKGYRMKNTSGGDLAAGDVVTFKAVAAGDEVTTTTIQGDDLVFGMVTAAIANNAYGYIQVLGKTTLLKVDGTTDIAIGDPLGTFTTAKIAMKAAAGDMAFAIALEAYIGNDSLGVIDALLITPRKI